MISEDKMNKFDFKKENKRLYSPSKKEVSIVDVPKMNFLMIDGKGDPNTSKEFKDAVETLFPVAYKIKFTVRKEQDIDYKVMPLEGLWWTDDMAKFSVDKKDEWKWTVMIMQPHIVKEQLFNKAVEEVRKSKKPPAVDLIRFMAFHEGKSAQIMHVGPYSEEPANIHKIHQTIADKGFKLKGKHHEIYLKDFTKTKPENLLTVIRQPFSS
jgi:hypothetical protein